MDTHDEPAAGSSYPYVGPLTFTRNEADRFFGREREARDLLALVVRERLVLFFAQSGAGKSSLLNTRLIPNLPGQGFDVLPVARVSGDIPAGVDPTQVPNVFIYNLILTLDRGLPEAERWTAAELAGYNLLRYLAGDEVAAHSEAAQASGTTPPAEATPDLAPTVLVIDQFEEIFTTHVDQWDERPAFFAQLRTALEWLPNLWVVLTMREDYVPRLEPYAELLPNRLRARFYMERMGEAAALEAVERPAEKFGRPFEPGVAQTLVNNLRRIRVQYRDEPPLDKYVEPVQLQVVCLELWKKLHDRPLGPITEGDLPLDYIDQALTNFYVSALVDTLADPKVQAAGVTEQALRDWFSHELITETGIRNTIPRNEKTHLTGTLPSVAVDVLKSRFLIRTEPRAGAEWVELVHDRFIGPIQESNQAWRDALLQQDPLLRAADQWEKAGRSQDLLLTGTALAQALALTGQTRHGTLVRAFLDASQEMQRELDLAEAQRREEDALRQAAEATRQAEIEKRTARALRWQRIALAVLAGLAFLFLLVALQQRGDALEKATALDKANRDLQISAVNLTTTNAALGLTNAALGRTNTNLTTAKTAAEDSAQLAEAERTTGLSRSLASQSSTRLNEGSTASALLLGLEATTISPTLESQTALLSALESAYRGESGEAMPVFPVRSLTITGESALQAVALSSDGRILAMGDRAGGVQWWDMAANQAIGQRVPAHGHGSVLGLAFDPTQPRLASASGDINDPRSPLHDIVLWNLSRGTPVSETLASNVVSVSSLAFSPDGQTLAVRSLDGHLTLWDLTDPTEPVSRTLATDLDGGGLLAFDTRGRQLAVATGDGRIVVWPDVTASQPVSRTLSEPGQTTVNDLEFSPSGRWLASTSVDQAEDGSFHGVVRRWDTTSDTSTPTILHQRENEIARRLAFASNGQMAVGWDDGLIELLAPTGTGYQPAGSIIRSSAVTGLVFDPTQSNVLVAIEENGPQPLVWDLDRRREFAGIQRMAVMTSTLAAVSADGRLVAQGNADGSVSIVRRDASSQPITLTTGIDTITALAVNPAGEQLAVAGCGPANVPEAQKQTDITQQAVGDQEPAAGGQGLCPDAAGWIEVWDVAAQKPTRLARAGVDRRALHTLAFHPTQPALVGGSRDGTLVVFDSITAGGIESRTWLEKVPRLADVTFDSNGTELAALATDGLIRIWRWSDGTRLDSQPARTDERRLYAHIEYVNRDAWLAINLRGKPGDPTATSAKETSCVKHAVELWDRQLLKPSKAQLTLERAGMQDPVSERDGCDQQSLEQTEVRDLVFDHDRQVLTVLQPDRTLTWQLGRDLWPDLACVRAGRNLTYAEWESAFLSKTIAEYAQNPTCPAYLLDDSFVAAKRAAAMEAARDCTNEGREQGLVLLQEAIDLPIRTAAAFSPSAEIVRILSDEALYYLRSGPVEGVDQARLCLRQAQAELQAAGNTTFDLTEAILAAQGLTTAERGLNTTLDDEALGLVLDDLDQATTRRAQWPGDLQKPLAEAYYILCDRHANAEACNRLDELIQMMPYGTTVVGRVATGQADYYYFRGRQGDIVNIALNAESGEFDPLLRLEGPGDTVELNDDSPRGGLNSLIANYVLPQDGVYRILPRAYSGEGRYRLSLQGQKPTSIQLGETRSGTSDDVFWSFDAQAGDTVGIAMNADDKNLDPAVQLLDPDLRVIGSDDNSGGLNNALLVTTLPADGTYRIRAASAGRPGLYTLSLLEPRTLPLTVTQVVSTTPTALWVFTGTLGTVLDVALDAAGGLDDAIELALSQLGGPMLDGDGDTGDIPRDVLQARVNDFILPTDGRYVVRATSLARTLPLSLTLSVVAPGTLVAGEPVTSTNLLDPIWTFEGQAGTIVDLAMDRFADGLNPYLRLLRTDGSLVAEDTDSGGELNARLASLILPADGAYYVKTSHPDRLDTQDPYTLTLTTVSPPTLGAGSPVTATTRTDPLWRFDGRTGQVIDLALTSRSPGFDPTLSLLDASGGLLAGDDSRTGIGDARIDAFILQQDGRYFVRIDPANSSGTYQLTLSERTPPSIEPGTPVTSSPVENPLWSLTAEAGQVFSMVMSTTAQGFNPYLAVYDSQGVLLADNSGYPTARISPFVAPAAGVYLLATGPRSTNDFYTLSVDAEKPEEMTIDNTVTSTTEEQRWWAFTGRAGEMVDISLSDTTDDFDPYLTLYRPDGTSLASDDDAGGDFNALIKAIVLPEDGRYLVRVDPIISSAPYSLRVAATPTQELPVGTSVTIEQDSVWTFAGTADQLVTVSVDNGASLALLDPQGNRQAERTARLAARLRAAGTYTVVVDLLEGNAPPSLRLEVPSVEVGTLVAGTPATGEAKAGETDYWQWEVDAPGGVVLSATRGIDLNLFAPGGAPIVTNAGHGRLVSTLPVTGTYLLTVQPAAPAASGQYTLTASTIDLPPVPQACGLSGQPADFGPVRIGSQVVLGAHRPIRGQASWDLGMQAYVGRQAIVVAQGGADDQGCPVVLVDADNGTYLWRIRDLTLLP